MPKKNISGKNIEIWKKPVFWILIVLGIAIIGVIIYLTHKSNPYIRKNCQGCKNEQCCNGKCIDTTKFKCVNKKKCSILNTCGNTCCDKSQHCDKRDKKNPKCIGCDEKKFCTADYTCCTDPKKTCKFYIPPVFKSKQKYNTGDRVTFNEKYYVANENITESKTEPGKKWTEYIPKTVCCNKNDKVGKNGQCCNGNLCGDGVCCGNNKCCGTGKETVCCAINSDTECNPKTKTCMIGCPTKIFREKNWKKEYKFCKPGLEICKQKTIPKFEKMRKYKKNDIVTDPKTNTIYKAKENIDKSEKFPNSDWKKIAQTNEYECKGATCNWKHEPQSIPEPIEIDGKIYNTVTILDKKTDKIPEDYKKKPPIFLTNSDNTKIIERTKYTFGTNISVEMKTGMCENPLTKERQKCKCTTDDCQQKLQEVGLTTVTMKNNVCYGIANKSTFDYPKDTCPFDSVRDTGKCDGGELVTVDGKQKCTDGGTFIPGKKIGRCCFNKDDDKWTGQICEKDEICLMGNNKLNIGTCVPKNACINNNRACGSVHDITSDGECILDGQIGAHCKCNKLYQQTPGETHSCQYIGSPISGLDKEKGSQACIKNGYLEQSGEEISLNSNKDITGSKNKYVSLRISKKRGKIITKKISKNSKGYGIKNAINKLSIFSDDKNDNLKFVGPNTNEAYIYQITTTVIKKKINKKTVVINPTTNYNKLFTNLYEDSKGPGSVALSYDPKVLEWREPVDDPSSKLPLYVSVGGFAKPWRKNTSGWLIAYSKTACYFIHATALQDKSGSYLPFLKQGDGKLLVEDVTTQKKKDMGPFKFILSNDPKTPIKPLTPPICENYFDHCQKNCKARTEPQVCFNKCAADRGCELSLCSEYNKNTCGSKTCEYNNKNKKCQLNSSNCTYFGDFGTAHTNVTWKNLGKGIITKPKYKCGQDALGGETCKSTCETQQEGFCKGACGKGEALKKIVAGGRTASCDVAKTGQDVFCNAKNLGINIADCYSKNSWPLCSQKNLIQKAMCELKNGVNAIKTEVVTDTECIADNRSKKNTCGIQFNKGTSECADYGKNCNKDCKNDRIL